MVSVVVRGWDQKRGLNVKGNKDNFMVMGTFHIFVVVMAAISKDQNLLHCTLPGVLCRQCAHLKCLNFVVCK